MKRTPLKQTPFKRKPYIWRKKPKSDKPTESLFPETTRESKTAEWRRILTEEKQHFIEMGITRCELRFEGCWICPNFSKGWTFAHSLKRDKVVSFKEDPEERDREMREIIYACRHCHNIIEQPDPTNPDGPWATMYHIVTTVIANRKILGSNLPLDKSF